MMGLYIFECLRIHWKRDRVLVRTIIDLLARMIIQSCVSIQSSNYLAGVKMDNVTCKTL